MRHRSTVLNTTTLPPGVLVLGMHRSGTSVVAGLMDAFGLDGGPRETMVSADEFNSDGYWEQRPLVEFHDEVLGRIGGYASAPPAVTRVPSPSVVESAYPRLSGLLSSFGRRPWFMKDPRQCLLLDAWSPLLDPETLHVVVLRHPAKVIRSLRHRNGYSPDLAAGVWARYTKKLLEGLNGRPCFFIHYETILARPHETVAALAAVIADRFPELGPLDDSRIARAAALVRPPETASSSGPSPTPERYEPEVDQLYDVVRALEGYVASFECPPLPPLPEAGELAIRARRRKLIASRWVPRLGSRQRAFLDRRRTRRS